LEKKAESPHADVNFERRANGNDGNTFDIRRLQLSVSAVGVQLRIGHEETGPLWLHRQGAAKGLPGLVQLIRFYVQIIVVRRAVQLDE
jgi:hypothetical protein